MKTVIAILCLGPAAATLWDNCDWIESDSNTDNQRSLADAATPDECIAMVMEQCPAASIANIISSGSGGCYCQYGSNPIADNEGWMSCVLSTATVTLAPTTTPKPTPEGYRDMDGDDVNDVAPEGSCCISQYGVGFSTNSDSCGSTLAEVVASGCCERPFVARYHLGNEESTDSYDCVSFIGKAECESMYYIWSGPDDDPAGLSAIGGCPHSAGAIKSDSATASGPALLTFLAAAAAAAF